MIGGQKPLSFFQIFIFIEPDVTFLLFYKQSSSIHFILASFTKIFLFGFCFVENYNLI